MAKPKLSLDESLKVSAEARAVLASAVGPKDQAKAKAVLSAALDALVAYADAEIEAPKE